MSKMNDLAYDIEQMYIEGVNPLRIAKILECPVQIVYDWIDSNGLGVVEKQQEDFSPFATANS